MSYNYNLGKVFGDVASVLEYETAVVYKDQSYSFQELDHFSSQVAAFFLSKGIVAGDVVAIFNDKSIMGYAVMLGALKIGAIYCNLDPDSPKERLERMLDVCQPKLLLTFNTKLENISLTEFPEENILNFNEIINNVSISDQILSDINEFSKKINGNTPAYIMFTSGSTGFPKGVVISHQNVMNFIQWVKHTYRVTSQDRFTNVNPLHFDNSVFDFYGSVFNGAAIIPVKKSLSINPKKMIRHLNELHPTIWFSVPSMFVYVLNMRALEQSDLQSLRVATFGGEGFPKNQLRKLWNILGGRSDLINVYGPTECTCICSSYVVTQEDLESDELLPLGPMAPNFYGLVLDDQNKKVEDGETGELILGGPNVGVGYYNNQLKTEEVFINDPTISAYGPKVYKTGDLVKYDVQHDLYYFAGRKDNQIKRMGYRIELEEIENAFNTIRWIKEAAVVYIDNAKFKSKIIACLSSENNDDKEILEVLKKYLPSYMLPDLFFYFESLPKNQNGKIDRVALKKEFSEDE